MEDGSHSYSDSTRIYLPKPPGSSSSGLTLVLPSLKSLKARQNAQAPPPTAPYDVEAQEKRIPRPVKLKPLKEVLTKLINQIKKKDDYAFFLAPVDAAAVPGYSDVIKHPMDFGTMGEKVRKGKYRSLEDFAADLRLVTGNAKAFNPPGSIYHTEAERIESWSIDHINKAASTVIQNEIDWTIDVEGDEGSTVNIEDDGDEPLGGPMDVDQKPNERERSVSVVSQPQPGPSSGRRGPRGPYRKNTQNNAVPTLTETLEPEGGLPGSKDGLGAFPANSAWAKTMLVLKTRAKRYKTKKERLRIEKEGPPLLPDGSLDYYEVEDPFSVLSFFVPDPPSRPQLVPLYPPLYNPTSQSPQSQSQTGQSQPPPTPSHAPSHSSQIPPHPPPPTLQPSTSSTSTSSASAPGPGPTSASVSAPAATTSSQSQAASHTLHPSFPSSTTFSRGYEPPTLPTIPLTHTPSTSSTSSNSNVRRRHWHIVRNHSTRQAKGKDREDDGDGLGYGYGYGYVNAALAESSDSKAPGAWWQVPREPAVGDWGSFGALEADVNKDVRKILPPEEAVTVPTSAAAQNAARLLATLVPPGTHRIVSPMSPASPALWQYAATLTRPTGSPVPPGTYTETTEQETALGLIRQSLDPLAAVKNIPTPASTLSTSTATTTLSSTTSTTTPALLNGIDANALLSSSYFTPQRAAEAEVYLRDVVYGGIEGLAYVRSLAEFMNYRPDPEWHREDPPAKDTDEKRRPPGPSIPLVQYVERNVVDSLTGGKHAILREAAIELEKYHDETRRKGSNYAAPSATLATKPCASTPALTRQIASQIPKSLHLYPAALFSLSALMQIRLQKIDMAALIKDPEEIYVSEEVWAGKGLKEEKRRRLEMEKKKAEEKLKLEHGSQTEADGDDRMDVDGEATVPPIPAVVADGEPPIANTSHDANASVASKESAELTLEGPEELGIVLQYVAAQIKEVEQKHRECRRSGGGYDDSDTKMKVEDDSATPGVDEDPKLKNLRLNLLALAKRAPLDTIASLPKDLVPERIRQFIPPTATA